MPTKKDAVDGAPVHIQYGNFPEVHEQTISTKTSFKIFSMQLTYLSFAFQHFLKCTGRLPGMQLNSRPSFNVAATRVENDVDLGNWCPTACRSCTTNCFDLYIV